MTALKTQKNNNSIQTFIDAIENDKKEIYAKKISIIKDITQEESIIWETSNVGFGTYHYVYKSGRAVDWLLSGFSPRKIVMTFYTITSSNNYDALLQKLSKYTIAKSCLYIKKIEDVDINIPKELIAVHYSYSTKISNIN